MKKLVLLLLLAFSLPASAQVYLIGQSLKGTDFGTGLDFWPALTVKTIDGGGNTLYTTTVTVPDSSGVVHHLVKIVTLSADGLTVTNGGYKQTD